jgi:hypothetical protein
MSSAAHRQRRAVSRRAAQGETMPPPGSAGHATRRVAFVTGMSARGRAAMRAPQDAGWKAMDNLPLLPLPAPFGASVPPTAPI